jgi:hypothetical protein
MAGFDHSREVFDEESASQFILWWCEGPGALRLAQHWGIKGDHVDLSPEDLLQETAVRFLSACRQTWDKRQDVVTPFGLAQTILDNVVKNSFRAKARRTHREQKQLGERKTFEAGASEQDVPAEMLEWVLKLLDLIPGPDADVTRVVLKYPLNVQGETASYDYPAAAVELLEREGIIQPSVAAIARTAHDARAKMSKCKLRLAEAYKQGKIPETLVPAVLWLLALEAREAAAAGAPPRRAVTRRNSGPLAPMEEWLRGFARAPGGGLGAIPRGRRGGHVGIPGMGLRHQGFVQRDNAGR